MSANGYDAGTSSERIIRSPYYNEKLCPECHLYVFWALSLPGNCLKIALYGSILSKIILKYGKNIYSWINWSTLNILYDITWIISFIIQTTKNVQKKVYLHHLSRKIANFTVQKKSRILNPNSAQSVGTGSHQKSEILKTLLLNKNSIA